MQGLSSCKLSGYILWNVFTIYMTVWQNGHASNQKNLVCIHRGLPTGIYKTSTAEECQFVATDCKANFIVVEDQNQLDKILEVTHNN